MCNKIKYCKKIKTSVEESILVCYTLKEDGDLSPDLIKKTEKGLFIV